MHGIVNGGEKNLYFGTQVGAFQEQEGGLGTREMMGARKESSH